METKVFAVDASKIGRVTVIPRPHDILDKIELELDLNTPDGQSLEHASQAIKKSDVPVAFPTETVYGLGADATRSEAVKGIYKAKQRPSDNPLIVHFSSLEQLRRLLRPSFASAEEIDGSSMDQDPIPQIYHSLIAKFWPGPLTIILPNPPQSLLAPEVTAGLSTFGARIPRHLLALAIIESAGVPVAAPSANASTKPSPTAAEHVAYDLDGRIETIIDGGPCDVGVESTVVDGLSDPPLILRPGGISLDQLRSCQGWSNIEIGYKNVSEIGSKPKAPGMKYRHYSPKATVILAEAERNVPTNKQMHESMGPQRRIGMIRTKAWIVDDANSCVIANRSRQNGAHQSRAMTVEPESCETGFAGMLQSLRLSESTRPIITKLELLYDGDRFELLDIGLGADTATIARGIFSALRILDRNDVDAIFVEGIDDDEGDLAAAIMNRLRKAAELRI